MGEAMTCMIWCDLCVGENWEDVSSWVEAGRATTRSGRLKTVATCRSCGATLPAGSSAEAITVHGGGRYAPWEDEVLEPATGWEAVSGGYEPGRRR